MPALPSVLPLFPLPNAVLFPHVPLPLHVFEPRYRKMVEDALASHRAIGMVLLQPGWEADYEGRPPVYPVGCAGTIETSEKLAQGRFNILLRGARRFRILEEQLGEPYRLARVQYLDDAGGELANLEAARKKVLAAIARAADGPVALVLQGELPPHVFVNALSQSLNLDPLEKQSLLDCDAVPERFSRLLEILDFHALAQSWGTGRSGGVH